MHSTTVDTTTDLLGGIMKKLLFVAVFVLPLFVFDVPATAHGTCTAQVGQLQHGAGFVSYAAGVNCGSAHGISLQLSIQRRTPGGSWSTVETRVFTAVSSTNLSGFVQHNAFNCAKDYRGKDQGNAQPGGHTWNKNTAILSHSC